MYDRKTLTDLVRDVPLTRLLYMTETIQRCAAALPDSIRQRTDAELCLLRLCDESLNGDVTALTGRLSALEDAIKRGVPAAPQRSTVPAPAAKEERPPCRTSRPCRTSPPPEDDRRRVFDVPVPARPAAKQPAAPAPNGDTALWDKLINHYKGRAAGAVPRHAEHGQGRAGGRLPDRGLPGRFHHEPAEQRDHHHRPA